MSSDNSPKPDLDNFLNMYKPIKYTNESIEFDTTEYEKYKIHPATNINNLFRHFINKYRVFSLLEEYIKETNVKYDAIVTLRIDLFFNDPFNFENIQNNTIYIPSGRNYDNYDTDCKNAINDQVAYGDFETMKKYCSICFNVKYLLDTQSSELIHPESLVYSNIKFYNLNIKRVEIQHILNR
jgi:hypothetical protein